ncbi:hypothetical protein G7054_g6227 [Neopestalotiopsis clavispora]|nr:hypothetical protein G7054_g6227 [Neopestalotiopsis clavispora]
MFPTPNLETNLFIEFQTFVGAKKQVGRTCEGQEADYVPLSALREFWTEEKIEQILALCDISTVARVVRQHYLLVFSILVYTSPVDGLYLLNYFRNIQTYQTDDHTLPWIQPPGNVFDGPHASHIYELISKHQWMFCPVIIDQEKLMSDRRLSPLHVLPIAIDPVQCISHEGRDAELSVINIDARAHSHLAGVTPKRAVMKTYQRSDEEADGEEAYKEEAYEDERRSYEALCGKHPNVLGYLGSFRCGKTFSILLEYAEEGTLDDLFNRNDTPHTYDEIQTFWKSFLRLVEGLEMIHNASVVHQDPKPSNIFVFKNNSLGPSPFSYTFKIGDFGNSYIKARNRDGHERDGPHRGGSRIYDPPEVLLGDSIDYQVNTYVDIWGIGCIIVESAVWVAFGKRGRAEFWALRMQETSQVLGHRDLGHGACFHDGDRLLQCVEQGVADKLNRNGRKCDTITSAMVELMVRYALAEKDQRDRARQLLVKMKKKFSPKSEPTPEPSPSLGEHPGANTTGRFSSETESLSLMYRKESEGGLSSKLPRFAAAVVNEGPSRRPVVKKPETVPTSTTPLVPGPSTTKPSTVVPDKTEHASSTKVTMKDLIKWMEDTKNGIYRKLPGWESARKLLGGRDFGSQLLLIDNSKFMQKEKDEVSKVVKALSYLLKKLDRDGIEVACTSSPGNIRRFSTATDIERFVKNEFHSGHDADCGIEFALNLVLKKVRNKYLKSAKPSRLSRIGTFPSSTNTSEGISIFVFTNGQWDPSETGICGADNSILGLINEIDTLRTPRTQICFQFVRFGNSEIGKRRLKFLDDDLSKISQNAI